MSDHQTPERPEETFPRAVRRRALLVAILRSAGVAIVGYFLYFTLPFDSASAFPTGLALSIGLVAVAALTAWQVWAISHSPFPLIRAIEGLITTFPLVILLFATTYFVTNEYQPNSFTQHMTRIDSLYFTVTTFATVGYGDIAPITESARLTATLQMIVDLLLIGLVVRAFAMSVRTGLARRDGLTPR